MVSTYSPNINLEEPARGDQVGTWDTPVNANMTLLDLVVGGRTSVTLNNSPVTLSAAQFQCKTITFSSTLTGSVAITFPSTFTKSYEIYNSCTGSSAFVVTLQTTVAGGAYVCAPPGEYCTVLNIGTGIVFTNLGRIGTYWDYAGSSVPAWVSGTNPPPYLNCDGAAFSATTYPQLAVILGSTTLPDSKGRLRAVLNQGSARITSGTSTGGVDGNTAYSAGGSQITTLSSQNMPSTPVTDPGHTHTPGPAGSNLILAQGNAGAFAFTGGATAAQALTIANSFTNITVGSTSPTNFSNLPPMYVGGLTLIRAG